MDVYQSAAPPQIYTNPEPTTLKADDTHRTNDIKLAGSAGGQFVEDFSSKIDNLIEEICRDVEEKMNAYILSKGSKPIFNQQRKPINLDLSANEVEVAMLDFPGNIGPYVLPAEFRAKEDDEHLDDGARNHDDKVKILESHQRTNLDIAQKIQSAINEGRLCFATPRKSYAKDDRFDKRNQSRWSSRKKSSVQKKQLHKLSAEKLRERGMAWVPKGSVQVPNETYIKVEVGAKNEKGVRRCAANQRFASNHQVLSPPYYTYSSPMPPIPMSWNQFSGELSRERIESNTGSLA
uniref:Uncharacterized protein n=1 Tax=Oryza meridionalis TaxID=40149 RepID=A0A0E0D2M1_9ORYZ